MAKVTLDNITANSNLSSQVATINENFQEIAAAIENSFSRDGTSPNQAEANLDMNSKRIYNLPAPASANDAARFQDVSDLSDTLDQYALDFDNALADSQAAATAAANSAANASASATDSSDQVILAAAQASAAAASALAADASADAAAQSAQDAADIASTIPSGINFAALSSGTPDNTDLFIFGDSSAGDVAKKATAHDTFVALHKKGSDIASASTINLDTATGDLVDVTGTTSITAVTLAEGKEVVVRFTGALTLTNGASLVLPGGANITTASGDFATFKGYSGGVVRVSQYQKASGLPIVSPTVLDTSVVGIVFVIDNGASAITTGVKGYLEIPFACTITRATCLADVSGSIVVDVWKDTYANYPPTDADSITASAPITISSSTKSQDSTLTGWTTSISAGDILGFNVDSATTIKKVTIILRATRI